MNRLKEDLWKSDNNRRDSLADQAFAMIDVKNTTKQQLVELCRRLAREMKGAVHDMESFRRGFTRHEEEYQKLMAEKNGAIAAFEDVLVRLISGD